MENNMTHSFLLSNSPNGVNSFYNRGINFHICGEQKFDLNN